MVSSLLKPRIVNEYMRGFTWPGDLEQKKAMLDHWVTTLNSGVLTNMSESSLHADFLKDIFESVLGYPTVVTSGGTEWNLYPEKHTSLGGGTADAALGFFSEGSERMVAPIELKGVREDLDRVQSRGYTTVQQGWRYANETPNCRWVIVSNYREVRLYHVLMTPAFFESFTLDEIQDDTSFRRFYFLLCRDSAISREGPSVLDRILKDTGEAEESITKELYLEYRQTRLDLLNHLVARNPNRTKGELVEVTQKLLDRVLFISFCEDRGLLPRNIVQETYNQVVPGLSRWMAFQLLFRAIDRGHPQTHISGYDGGLFAEDPVLDSLSVGDDACDLFLALARYDYESEVTVNILGHIFEQSISDIEALKNGGVAPGESRRKKDGIYYTPAYITRYIAEQVIGTYLSQKFDAIVEKYKPESVKAAKKQRAAWKQIWEEYRGVLSRLRVCDPACGSGAFLVAAFDVLLAEYSRVNAMIAELDPKSPGQLSLFDLNRAILSQNLFGVDLNPESVEITKLSLWIKTAEQGKTLTHLDDNIKCGNSIVDDPNIDPKAFRWREGFPSVFADGGFHAIIGNPPYIKLQNFKSYHPEQANWIVSNFQSARSGNFDMYLPFIEKGLSLLHPHGRMGFIAPSLWLVNEYGKALRQACAANRHLGQWVDFKSFQVFRDSITYTALQFFSREPSESVEFAVASAGDLADLSWSAQPYDSLGEEPWVLLPEAERTFLNKVTAACDRLDQVVEGIPQGLITSADDVYHLVKLGPGRYFSRALGTAVNLEDSIMRPLISGNQAVRFTVPVPKMYLLFPYDLSGDRPRLLAGKEIDGEYPNAWAYLKAHEDKLRGRERGKFDQDGSWWQFGRNQNLDKQHRAKLGVAEIVPSLRVFPDLEGRFFFNNVRVNGILVPADDQDQLLYLLGILNSPVPDFVFRRTAKPKVNGYFEANKEFIAPLPIPRAQGNWRRLVIEEARELTVLHTSRARVVAEVDHRIVEDLTHGVRLSQTLRQWEALSLSGIREELRIRYKVDIPVGDRKGWEDYIEKNRAVLGEADSRIARIERRLSFTTYRIFGLTKAEIGLVEADH